MDASYNDIQPWKFKDLLAVFGADPKKSKSFQVRTKQELHDLFNDKEFSTAPYIQVCPKLVCSKKVRKADSSYYQFVELYVPKEDAPVALKLTAEASARTNAKQ